MKLPEIELHGFSVSRRKLRMRTWWLFAAVAVVPIFRTVQRYLTGDALSWGSMPLDILLTTGLLACVAGVFWFIYHRQWKRERALTPALSIGPEGIHDRRFWKQPIPWSRIKHVEPMTQDPQKKYYGFKIMVDGRNDISKSELVRLFHNRLVIPMGGDPGFTISFLDIDPDKDAVAALVRNIVAAAKT